ncbi:MAG: DNA internalization-related competence protein ComEC/Rec2 [Rubricoccaceae bacterium]
MALRPLPAPLRLSSRPLVGVALALAMGIVAGLWVSDVWIWALGILASVLGVLAHALITRRALVTLRGAVLAGAVGLVAMSVGGLRMAAWTAVPPDSIAHIAQDASSTDDALPVTLWARIAEVPTTSEWSHRFVTEVDSVGQGDIGGTVSGRVQVSLARTSYGDTAPLYPALRLGDRVRLTGQLQMLPVQRNPADFDYGTFLAHRGIDATLRIRDGQAVTFLAPTRQLDDRLALAVQDRVRRAVARYVPNPESQAVLLALLLADRSQLDDATTDTFRETGLMHLLAVSGLHVFLVGLAAFVLLGPLLMRTGLRRQHVMWIRATLSLGLLAVYVLVTGGSVSVVRAFVMALIMIIGTVLERRRDSLNTLGAAAIVLLVMRPTALFEVGFQLSFSAVAALVTITPHMTQAVPIAWRSGTVGKWITSSSIASIAATLGTAPVLLVHFGRVALGGLVLNLPAIPLTGATLGAGIGTVICAPIPWLGETFGALASASGWALVQISTLGAETLGGAAVVGFLDDGWIIAALATLLFAGALWRRPVARLRLGLAALALVAVSLGSSVIRGDASPQLDVVFLDVGQGDATLLRLPNGRHVLIDAGVRSPFSDQGERTVAPHLERYGIRQLDAVVMTHADADHIGGVPSVLRSVEVAHLIHNGQTKDNEIWTELVTTADSLDVEQQIVRAGDALDLDPSVRIRVLSPSATPQPGDDANDASIILLVEYGQTRWLLTGDAETEAEAQLVARYGSLLQADVVKVGHHGSRTSSSPELVAAVSGAPVSPTPIRHASDTSASGPAFAIVSVAKRNRYGLPNAEPLMRWQDAGAEVLQTADEGAIWLRSDGETIERVNWR